MEEPGLQHPHLVAEEVVEVAAAAGLLTVVLQGLEVVLKLLVVHQSQLEHHLCLLSINRRYRVICAYSRTRVIIAIINHLLDIRMKEFGRRRCDYPPVDWFLWCARCVVVLSCVGCAIVRVRPGRNRDFCELAHGWTNNRN